MTNHALTAWGFTVVFCALMVGFALLIMPLADGWRGAMSLFLLLPCGLIGAAMLLVGRFRTDLTAYWQYPVRRSAKQHFKTRQHGKAEGAFLFLLIIHWRSSGLLTAHRGPSGRWCALPNLFALFFTHEVAGKIIFRQSRSRNHDCESCEQQFHSSLPFSRCDPTEPSR